MTTLDHDNIFGEDETHGVIMVSIEAKQKTAEQKILKCIIRTRKVWGMQMCKKNLKSESQADERVALVGRIDKPFPEGVDGRIKMLKEQRPEFSDVKFHADYENHEEIVEKLINFERQLIKQNYTSNYKFGILYMDKGQKDDDEFFNNGTTANTVLFQTIIS